MFLHATVSNGSSLVGQSTKKHRAEVTALFEKAFKSAVCLQAIISILSPTTEQSNCNNSIHENLELFLLVTSQG